MMLLGQGLDFTRVLVTEEDLGVPERVRGVSVVFVKIWHSAARIVARGGKTYPRCAVINETR